MAERRQNQRDRIGGRISRPLKRAASLLEVVVALAVFAMVTTLITAVFTLAHRYTRVYHQLSTAQRECVRCMQSLTERLRQCRAETLQPVTAVNVCWGLSCVPPQTLPKKTEFDPATGDLRFHKWQGIWCQSDGQVWVAELPLSGGAATFPETVVDPALLAPAPTSQAPFLAAPGRHLLAKSVRRFQVTAASSRLVHVEIETQSTESGNPATRYLLTSNVPGQ